MRRSFMNAVLFTTIITLGATTGIGEKQASANPTDSPVYLGPQAVAIGWNYTTGNNGPYFVELWIYVNNVPAGYYSISSVPSNTTKSDYVGTQKPGPGSTYHSYIRLTDASGVASTYMSGTYTVP